MFFFLSPLAEVALPLDDYSFIDHLWHDWSPAYDGSWDVARVKESIGVPERILAAIGTYRALYDPSLQVPDLAEEEAAALQPTPKPTLYLHGRDDGCMLLSSIGSPLDFLAEGSEMDIVDGTGHFLHLERPDVVNPRIVGFLTAPSTRHLSRRTRLSAAGPPCEPFGHQRARHPLRPVRVVGPAARAGQTRLGDTAAPERLEQPSPPLAIRAGEDALAPRRRAQSPRVGSGRRPRGARHTGCAAGNARSLGATPCTPSHRGRTPSG